MSYGFASNLRNALPNASYIGFTGTPIEKTDANPRAVFGDYISIYDIQCAVADKSTVPIYYESRISKLSLNAAELPTLDAEFEEITEGEELTWSLVAIPLCMTERCHYRKGQDRGQCADHNEGTEMEIFGSYEEIE